MRTKIYVLTGADGRIRYVGKTCKALPCRFSVHLFEARKGIRNHRCNWIRSVLSKGCLPSMQLIGEVEGDGCKEEIAWIKYFRDEGVDLVNETDGGEGALGHIVSPETRAKMSVARKGRPASPEVCAKLLAASKGHQVSPETRAKISAAHKGWRATPKTRVRMSAAKKGNTNLLGYHHSLETRAKLSASLKGNANSLGCHCSAETRAKLSATQKGRHASPETRAKMSIANKNWRNAKKAKTQ